MFLVPYKRIIIESPLTLDEARCRIEQAVDRRPWWQTPGSDKYFRASTSADSEFRLIPITEMRSTYTPVAYVSLRGAPGKTRAEVIFSLQPGALGVIGFLFIAACVAPFLKTDGISTNWLIAPVVVLAIHTALYFLSFLPEVRAAEGLLRELLAESELSHQSRTDA